MIPPQKFIPLKILSVKEKQRLIEKLNEQFGIKDIQGLILQRGKERIFLYQGSLNPKEIKDLESVIQIERVGTYFAKEQDFPRTQETDGEIRLSIEGTQILKDQITKNIFELNEEQLDDWMKGREILVESGMRGFVIMKYKNNFLGTGKASEKKISNFIPKNRRLKERVEKI